MWALTSILLIASIRPPLFSDLHERHGWCSFVEINYVVNQLDGKVSMVVVVFWGEDGRVKDWMYYRQDNFRIYPRRVEWRDGDLKYIVHYSEKCFRTRTAFDREMEDRKVLDEPDRVYMFHGRLGQEGCRRGIPPP